MADGYDTCGEFRIIGYLHGVASYKIGHGLSSGAVFVYLKRVFFDFDVKTF